MPWPHGGFGDSDYLAVWDHVLLPIAKDFNPDIVLISGGFDSGIILSGKAVLIYVLVSVVKSTYSMKSHHLNSTFLGSMNVLSP